MEMETNKNMRMLREAWAESNPAHCNILQRKTQRKNTKRRHKTWVLRKLGLELKPNHVCKQRLTRKMKKHDADNEGGEGGEGVVVRRGKNPRQGERKSRQRPKTKQTVELREQARSTRHAGRRADWYE